MRIIVLLIIVVISAPSICTEEFLQADFETGTSGEAIAEFQVLKSPDNTTYSNEIKGPFDGDSVIKIGQSITQKYFAGKITSLNLVEGEEIWVRWYQFFPEDFAFANGINGDDSGGAGSIKWLRFQYPATSERITFLVDATARCADPCENYLEYLVPEKFIGELMDWKNRYGNMNAYMTKKNYALGEWHAMQIYMKLSPGSADMGDGDGILRIWMGSELVAEIQRNTMPTNGGALRSIWLGDYWNGGFPKDQHWYVDEMTVTSARPSTVDQYGNPYIQPLSSLPMAPSDLTINN